MNNFSEKSSSSRSEVFYVDHKNDPSPLSYTYRLSSSRYLSSMLSTTIEIDSIYCPSCLDFQTAVAAIEDDNAAISASTSITKKRYCASPTCVQCPICMSPLTISIMKNENTNATTIILYYLCEYCRWNSLIENNNELCFDDNSLIVDLNKEINMLNDNKNNNIDNDKFDNIVKEGMNILKKKLNQQIILSKNNNGNDIFHSLIESWTLKNQGNRQQQQQRNEHHQRQYQYNKKNDIENFFSNLTNKTITRAKIPSNLNYYNLTKSNNNNNTISWSISDLEQSLQNKKIQQYNKNKSSIYVIEPNKLKAEERQDTNDNNDLVLSQQASQIMYHQGTLYPISIHQKQHTLLPIPYTLFNKKIRRCSSKPISNILIKPNINPLFGDTSWRGNHGRWWKKDDSAIHTIPKIQIMQHKTHCYNNRKCHFLLLKITNPTMGVVRLRFQNNSSTNVKDIDTSNLLLDYTKKIYAFATLLKQSSSLLPCNDILELQPTTKDTTLSSLSSSSSDCHMIVLENKIIQEWLDSIPPLPNKNLLLSPSNSNNTNNTTNDDDRLQTRIDIIHTNNDIAYIGMTIAQDEYEEEISSTNNTNFLAYPIVMEIEVGNGSWKLSGIEPNSNTLLENSENDYVPFTLLLVWDGNNSCR